MRCRGECREGTGGVQGGCRRRAGGCMESGGVLESFFYLEAIWKRLVPNGAARFLAHDTPGHPPKSLRKIDENETKVYSKIWVEKIAKFYDF